MQFHAFYDFTIEYVLVDTYFLNLILGQLFAKAPIDVYPGPTVEAVSDSSRYFVIKMQEDGGMYFVSLEIMPDSAAHTSLFKIVAFSISS